MDLYIDAKQIGVNVIDTSQGSRDRAEKEKAGLDASLVKLGCDLKTVRYEVGKLFPNSEAIL